MKLYFVRHGKAQPADGSVDDHDRQLTRDGAARLETQARAMAQLGIRPDHIYSSPRVRAQQTAEIIAQVLKKKVEIREEVNFDFDVRAVAALINGLPDDAEVMFVGHNPSMEDVVRALTGGGVIMKVGGLARVDITATQPHLLGQLVWLLAPKVFDALAK
jgi:phosphohistidine phosphatase